MQIPPFTLNRQFQEIGSEIESEVFKVLKGGQYIGGQEIANLRRVFSSDWCKILLDVTVELML